MVKFKSERLEKEIDIIFNAPCKVIFPLLCVRRELEWIPGWKYKEIFSKTGFMEKGFVYKVPGELDADFINYVSRYDKENFTLEIIKFSLSLIITIEISLSESGNNKTKAQIKYEITSLDEKGGNKLNEIKDNFVIMQPAKLEKFMNDFLAKK
jgi:hypothetical protein